MSNWYPEHLKVIVTYIDALNDIEEKLRDIRASCSYELPFLSSPKLVDGDGGEYGELVDEIGGAWSWRPSS